MDSVNEREQRTDAQTKCVEQTILDRRTGLRYDLTGLLFELNKTRDAITAEEQVHIHSDVLLRRDLKNAETTVTACRNQDRQRQRYAEEQQAYIQQLVRHGDVLTNEVVRLKLALEAQGLELMRLRNRGPEARVVGGQPGGGKDAIEKLAAPIRSGHDVEARAVSDRAYGAETDVWNEKDRAAHRVQVEAKASILARDVQRLDERVQQLDRHVQVGHSRMNELEQRLEQYGASLTHSIARVAEKVAVLEGENRQRYDNVCRLTASTDAHGERLDNVEKVLVRLQAIAITGRDTTQAQDARVPHAVPGAVPAGGPHPVGRSIG